jgi:AraC-like DNA-binding protein
VLLRNVVALLTTMLAIGMLVQAWRQRSYGLRCLAAWMLTLAACAWVIVLSIGSTRRMSPLGLLLVPLLSTPAGPLLLGYVLHAMRAERLRPAWFLPFAVHLAAAILLGVELNRWISLTSVIWLEYVCLVIAWWVWARSGVSARDRAVTGGVLAAVTALQLANVAQTLAVLGLIGLSPAVLQAPFYVVSAWSLVAIVFALLESPTLRRLAPALAPHPSTADAELFRRMQALMSERRAWSDPGFDVGALARQLGTHPNAISRALSRAGGTTFYDYVNGYRLREAERLLSDPLESRIKIEALGRQAGFRARSTFFKLFRERTGQTPSEYRAARNGRIHG